MFSPVYFKFHGLPESRPLWSSSRWSIEALMLLITPPKPHPTLHLHSVPVRTLRSMYFDLKNKSWFMIRHPWRLHIVVLEWYIPKDINTPAGFLLWWNQNIMEQEQPPNFPAIWELHNHTFLYQLTVVTSTQLKWGEGDRERERMRKRCRERTCEYVY